MTRELPVATTLAGVFDDGAFPENATFLLTGYVPFAMGHLDPRIIASPPKAKPVIVR